jgi:thiol:disulfide interchange protein
MKVMATLALVLALWPCQQASAQSDSFVCNHGTPSDQHTIDACARLRQPQSSAPAAVKSAAPTTDGQASAPAAPSDESTQAPVTAPLASSAQVAPAAPVAAAPKTTSAPTDAGEAPSDLTAANSDNLAGDQSNAESGFHPSWLAGAGAFVIIIMAIGAAIGLGLYFLPTIIAIARHKRNGLAIFAVNLFLGWSFIGWIAALVWSLTTDT